MITTIPELHLKRDEQVLEALQAGRVVWSTDAAEDLLLVVLQGRELLRRSWKRTLADHSTGMSGKNAAHMLDVIVKWASIEAQIAALVIKEAAQADAARRAEAADALREAQEIEAAAREMLDFVSSAPAPVDREDLARARAEWERGEGLEAKEMLARRNARRPA
jgi:hypothetical protein